MTPGGDAGLPAQRRPCTHALGRGVAAAAISVLLPLLCAAQNPQDPQPIGTIATRDARVTGGLEVQGETARLLTNVSVTAYDHPAPVALNRGGHVLVCSTSEFHLLHAGVGGSLIFGLDRGAVEIASPSEPRDMVMTPDLKFVPVTKGTLDLQLRVTREGDTCVNNAGAQAPVLNVTDPFSSASYRVLPGQHLLFVKGDLHKVVDHESEPCGCPPIIAPQVIAAKPGQPLTPAQAAAAHPFPQAQSEGLASSTAPGNEAPVGTASSQVSTTFSYGEGAAPPPGTATTGSGGSAAAAPGRPVHHNALWRFFHRFFHPGG